MYVKINAINYTKIGNLSFAPETDITGDSVPINELEVDILTDDLIDVGQYIELYDDLDNLWAKYWIIFAERMSDDGIVTVHAQSELYILDRKMMAATMYNATAIASVLSAIFGTVSYSLDSSFSNETITGFCPEQTARERLQWVCFCIGAYVKSYFNSTIQILPLDNTETIIPANKTFWKPSVTYKDYITAINVTAFTFTQGTPASTDDWVTDGTNYYIVSKQVNTLTNPDVPSNVPANTVDIDNVYLVNADNVSGILTHLSNLYFKRMSVNADIINNYEYEAGDKVVLQVDENSLVTGFIDSCLFTFGMQARATIHMSPSEGKNATNLIIYYMNNEIQLAKRKYLLPIDYAYSIENPYIDIISGRHRYVYYPENQYATGTIVSGTNTDYEDCQTALHFYYDTNILELLSVTELELKEAEKDEETIYILEIT